MHPVHVLGTVFLIATPQLVAWQFLTHTTN